MSEETIRFKASLPPVAGAIKAHGSKEGMRIMLDVPDSDMGSALRLVGCREVLLDVSVVPVVQ
jgi:hypothetical protein